MTLLVCRRAVIIIENRGMNVKLGCTVLAVLMVPFAAFAVEQNTTYNWTGAYVGGQVGYSWGTSRYSNEFDERFKFNPKGGLGGLYGGYNYQLNNNIVLGVEADFAFSDMKDNSGKYYDEGSLDPNMRSKLKMRWNGAARLRVGYALDSWLPYVAAGVSYGDYYMKASDDVDSSGKKSIHRTGWNVGAGVDYALSDSLIARVEYRYTDYGKASVLSGISDRLKLRTHDVRLGVAYKF